MKITLLTVGKVKEKFYQQAIQEFEKRLSKYCNLSIIEVADEKTPEHASELLQKKIKETEGNRLQKYIREDAYVCVLSIEGTQMDSVQLSKKIEKIGIDGVNHIQFIIGGSLGLSQEIIKQADFQLSFSKMTFPHQLMRIILLEQVYRSFRIMKNEPYHK